MDREQESIAERVSKLKARSTVISYSGFALTSNSEDDRERNYINHMKLYQAAKKNDVDQVVGFFLERNETLNELAQSFIYQSVGPWSNTLLHVAASFGSEETVRLIAHDLIGPSILERRNSEQDTALHVAAKAGHLSTAKALIQCGTQVVSPFSSLSSSSPLGLLPRMQNRKRNTALHEALINGHIEVAEALIEADPEVSFYLNEEGKSPLYLAAEAGSLKCVKCMLESTVQMNPDKMLRGKLATHAAILSAAASESTATDILKSLLEKEPRLIHLKDQERRTVLQLAAYLGYLEGVRYLLKNLCFYSCYSEQ